MLEFDFYILDFIRENIAGGPFDSIMIAVSSLGNVGLIWIALTAVLLCIKKYRRAGMIMAAALIIDLVICNAILKPLVARPRPFSVRPWIDIIISPPSDFSFPSGHTAASFAAASALFFERSKLKWPSGVLAVLIAFSRLYLYVHYPTDVLGGVAVGILCGYLGTISVRYIYRLYEKYSKK